MGKGGRACSSEATSGGRNEGQTDVENIKNCRSARNTPGVNKSRPDNLEGIDNAHLHQVAKPISCCVVAVVDVVSLLEHLSHDDGPLDTSVVRNCPRRLLDCLADDVHAQLLIEVGRLKLLERAGCLEKGGAAAGNNALFDSAAGGVKRVHCFQQSRKARGDILVIIKNCLYGHFGVANCAYQSGPSSLRPRLRSPRQP
ncbi:MAG: hypothetical protein BJ554DRAFT_7121 [Olpidium bornovanus]|uniref:Uncharacterized protein n=1 Tax=Olpidium bornovanus TaxID=278681 RepID=A0A8H8DJN5_9FUNG|nr:MAG: hypothetical protein BJ554DRAFT_7121 [Olpidium bornovanus]